MITVSKVAAMIICPRWVQLARRDPRNCSSGQLRWRESGLGLSLGGGNYRRATSPVMRTNSC